MQGNCHKIYTTSETMERLLPSSGHRDDGELVYWVEDVWAASECCLCEHGTCDPASAFHAGRRHRRTNDHSSTHKHTY